MVMRVSLGRRRREQGFSLLELAVAMLLIAILVVVVILAVSGFFGGAREAGMETDMGVVKTAVDSYMLAAFPQAPTANGQLPGAGEHYEIDFNASFVDNGKVQSFYPHFLAKLPAHWDEGVWLIDNVALVTVDLPAEEY